jgi:hypothetical protein
MTKRHRNNATRDEPQGGVENRVHERPRGGPPTTAAGHYLITLHTFNRVTLNAYRITEKDDDLEPAYDVLMQKAEELGLRIMPMLLATKLSSGIQLVEDEINRREGPKLDFRNKRCLVAWMARDDDPINEKLMALH